MPSEIAQSPAAGSPSAAKKELTTLEEARLLAEKKKEIAQLEKETLELQRQGATAGVAVTAPATLSGETTLGEKSGYLAELVVYHALRDATMAAATKIKASLPKPPPVVGVLMVETLDLAGQAVALALLTRQIGQMKAIIAAQLEANRAFQPPSSAPPTETPVAEGEADLEMALTGIVAAVSGVGSLLGSVATTVGAAGAVANATANIAALFRKEFAVNTYEVTVPPAAARHLLVAALGDCGVYLPALTNESESTLLKAVDVLIAQKLTLAQSAVTLAVHGDALPAEDADGKAAIKGAVQASTELIALADELIAGLTATSATAPAPLAQALAAEQMRNARYTHYLHMHVVSARGEITTQKKQFGSGQTTYAGGCVLGYVLAASDGRIVAADTLTRYSQLSVTDGTTLGKPENKLQP